MKYVDIIFGTIGTAGIFTLSSFNASLGCIAGIMTVAILAFRLRREWKNRNNPPDNDYE